jgi:ABC-type polysaccharide/polyol phosphate transport system ATPase subunit
MISTTPNPVVATETESRVEEETVIRVESVYKRYSRNEQHQRSLRHEALTMVKGLLLRKAFRASEEPFYALRDISFHIKKGESVGIVGRNGSGKSTLLRVLSGITRPTNGEVEVQGRFAALIALGAGFKPDLSGRQNIYLNSAIHGVPPREVEHIIDDIIGFSELGDFIDLPVSRYSSGMSARLGFSIAIHVLPDIVFLDEVLAVGDTAFQEKCMVRINEFTSTNRTVVFVSHAQAAVQNLCERTIWLHNGVIMQDGPTNEVLADYNQFLQEAQQQNPQNPDGTG